MPHQPSHFKPYFPVTVWPGTPISPVPVKRWKCYVLPDGRLASGRFLTSNPLPPEWVLRQLADADLDDERALAALLNDYGVLTRPYFNRANIPPDRWKLLAPPPVDSQCSFAGWAKASEAERALFAHWWEGREDGTLEDARWHLKTARVLAQVW